jgi:hypothetical protein
VEPQVHGSEDLVGHRDVDGGPSAAFDPGNRRRTDADELGEVINPEPACQPSLTDERSDT